MFPFILVLQTAETTKAQSCHPKHPTFWRRTNQQMKPPDWIKTMTQY